MTWNDTIAESLRPVVDLVYPPRCPSCGVAVAQHGGLCVDCWSEIEVPGEPACVSCSRPLPASQSAGEQCWKCREEQPRHSGIVAACAYNDVSRQLVLNFKHGRKLALAKLLGQMMASRLPDRPGEEPPLLIPVPLHRLRLWERGFNQAALLARELARLGKGDLLVDALIRTKRTPSLGGLGSEARREALSGAISTNAARKTLVKGRAVLLVDDVLTSGATTSACTDALLDAGAKSVTIVCFARVLSA